MELDDINNCLPEPFLEDNIFSDVDEESFVQMVSHAQRRNSSRKSLLLPLTPHSVQSNNHSPVVNQNQKSILGDLRIKRRSSFGLMQNAQKLSNSTSTPKNMDCSIVDIDYKKETVTTTLEHINITKKPTNYIKTVIFEEHGNIHSTQKSKDIEMGSFVSSLNVLKKTDQNVCISKGDDHDEFSPEKLLENYRSECSEWDKLTESYKRLLLSNKSIHTFPDKSWIENDHVVSKYRELIWPSENCFKRCSGKYDSLDEIIQSISNLSNTILYELERLPLLCTKQMLFTKSLRRKLKMKQAIKERFNFSTQPLYDVISDFISS